MLWSQYWEKTIFITILKSHLVNLDTQEIELITLEKSDRILYIYLPDHTDLNLFNSSIRQDSVWNINSLKFMYEKRCITHSYD